MKTSNKLLLGLFCLVIASLVIFNIIIKWKMDKASVQSETPISNNQKINTGLLVDSTKVTLSIDKNTTNDEINSFQTRLKELNIDLNIDKIEFGSDNKIKFLSISVDCNDGFKGSVNQTLGDNDKIGFYRVYDKNGQSPFGMCPLELE